MAALWEPTMLYHFPFIAPDRVPQVAYAAQDLNPFTQATLT
jgi:hypothetical protein